MTNSRFISVLPMGENRYFPVYANPEEGVSVMEFISCLPDGSHLRSLRTFDQVGDTMVESIHMILVEKSSSDFDSDFKIGHVIPSFKAVEVLSHIFKNGIKENEEVLNQVIGPITEFIIRTGRRKIQTAIG